MYGVGLVTALVHRRESVAFLYEMSRPEIWRHFVNYPGVKDVTLNSINKTLTARQTGVNHLFF